VAPPKGASQVAQWFDIVNIVQNFQNPKIDEDFLRMQELSTGTAESQPKTDNPNELHIRHRHIQRKFRWFISKIINRGVAKQNF